MISREQIVIALGNLNVQAFLHVIRFGESDNTDRAYYRVNGQPDITSLAVHPYHGIPTTQGSRAAGAYQFLGTTWARLADAYPKDCSNFSVYAQDFGAVALIAGRGALDDVLSGDVVTAVRKLREEWTSLPGAAENSGRFSMEQAIAVFYQYRGVVAEQPAAPIEDRSVPAQVEEEEKPMAPLMFIVPLLQSLATVFSPLLQQKLTKALDKQTGDKAMSEQMAMQLMAMVQQIATQGGSALAPTAATDPVTAVAVVKGDPVLVQKAETQIADYLDKLAPVLDRLERADAQSWAASEDSMDRAHARASSSPAEDWMAKTLVLGILVVSGFLIALVAGVAITQIALLQTRTPTTEVWAALTGIVGTTLGILGTVYAFRFGTSRSSTAKDVVIAEMSAKRRS